MSPGGPSQQYDPWAGQHVPSQGPGPSLLLPSHGAETVDAPGYPSAPAQTALSSSAAASPFPAAMSTPFAQASYPPGSAPDPWAAQPGFPSSSSAQPANPWGPETAYPSANPWNPMAAASNPWGAGAASQTPAQLSGDQGAPGSEYRTTDGRPAIALMVFGFAGKMYCWRPSSSGMPVRAKVASIKHICEILQT